MRRAVFGWSGLGLLSAALVTLLLTLALAPSWRSLALALLGSFLLAPIALGGAVVWSFGAVLGELRALARDRRTRVIHGLEHATAHLLTRDGYSVLGGQTYGGRFELHIESTAGSRPGVPTPKHLRHVVETAAQRILDGETELALHPSCGTSAVVAVLFVSLLVLAAAGIGFFAHLTPTVLIGVVGAVVALLMFAVRPLGLLVQRLLTVSTSFVEARAHGVVRSASPVAASAKDTICFEVHVDVALGSTPSRN
jgi:hypothetical protein